MQIQSVIDYLNEIYPLNLQEHYDNAGHKVGDASQDLSGILVTLDVTNEVIDEAIELGFNLIVSHHPMIFGDLKSLVPSNVQTRMLNRLIKNDICIYSAHTNLDNLNRGVSHILAQKLGLSDIMTLSENDDNHNGGGALGELPSPLACSDFINRVKNTLGLPFLKCSKNLPPQIKRVAVCGGSGSFLIDEAADRKADIYLTADIKYHDYQKAVGRISVADIGHYESEQFAQELIYNDIIKKFSNFACRITRVKTSYIDYK